MIVAIATFGLVLLLVGCLTDFVCRLLGWCFVVIGCAVVFGFVCCGMLLLVFLLFWLLRLLLVWNDLLFVILVDFGLWLCWVFVFMLLVTCFYCFTRLRACLNWWLANAMFGWIAWIVCLMFFCYLSVVIVNFVCVWVFSFANSVVWCCLSFLPLVVWCLFCLIVCLPLIVCLFVDWCDVWLNCFIDCLFVYLYL